MKKSLSANIVIHDNHEGQRPISSSINLNQLFDEAKEKDLVGFMNPIHTPMKDYAKWLRFAASKNFPELFQLLLKKKKNALTDLVEFVSLRNHKEIRALTHEHIYETILSDIFVSDDAVAIERQLSTGYRLQDYMDTKNRTLVDLVRHHHSLRIWKCFITKEMVSGAREQSMTREMRDIWIKEKIVVQKDDIFKMIRENDLLLIREWIAAGKPLNLRNEMGVSPLYEAVRLRRDEAVHLLRDAGAMFTSPVDAEQSFLTCLTKKSFFSRLDFLLREAVPRFFCKTADVNLFFHTVRRSPRLFCCSLRYQKDPDNDVCSDFCRRLSGYVIEAEDPMACFRPILREFKISCVSRASLFDPYFPERLLGKFFMFSLDSFQNNLETLPDQEVEDGLKELLLYRFDRLCSPRWIQLWEDCLLRSSVFWNWWAECCDFASSEESCIFYDPLHRLLRLRDFLGHKIPNPEWCRLKQILETHANTVIPATRVSVDVCNQVSCYASTGNKSFLMERICSDFLLFEFRGMPDPIRTPTKLTKFDLFEILGPNRALPPIDKILEFDCLQKNPGKSVLSREFLKKIRDIIGLEPHFRTSVVIGISFPSTGHYRVFLPPHEINEVVDWLFKRHPEPNVHDLATLYKLFVEYIHPYRDGNGRTFRLAFTLCLRSMGYPLLLTKGDPLIRRMNHPKND